jgi:hypothetical protein
MLHCSLQCMLQVFRNADDSLNILQSPALKPDSSFETVLRICTARREGWHRPRALRGDISTPTIYRYFVVNDDIVSDTLKSIGTSFA